MERNDDQAPSGGQYVHRMLSFGYRDRVAIEHDLARIGRTQGVRARFRGLAKSNFDLRRHIVVNNCYVLDGLWRGVG